MPLTSMTLLSSFGEMELGNWTFDIYTFMALGH